MTGTGVTVKMGLCMKGQGIQVKARVRENYEINSKILIIHFKAIAIHLRDCMLNSSEQLFLIFI